MNRRIAAVAAVLTLTGTLAFAGPGEGRRGGHGRHGKAELGAKFAEKLNLTDAQKAQIQQIRAASREQNKLFFDTAQANRNQARSARKAGDTATLNALKATLEADRQRFKEIRQAERQQILNILTPEQRTQFEAMKAEHEARRAQRGDKDRKPRH